MTAKTLKIPLEERYKVYRYYFSLMSKKNVIGLLKLKAGEKMVADARGFFNGRLSIDKIVFKDNLNDLTYPELAKKHKLGLRKITELIHLARTRLMTEIRRDLEAGILQVVEVQRPKKTPKRKKRPATLKDWEDFKNKVLNS